MTRPDDIPQDIWEAAVAAGNWLGDDMQAEATARAILAERERCARMADPVEPRGQWAATAYDKQVYDLRVNIAAAIRRAES